MQTALLPLFPLNVVVFPRTALPLHIFEPRYKEMVGEALANNSEFGIVLAKEEGIVNAGCTVVVEQVLQRYEDGRMDILTQGLRRFEVLYLNNEKDYLRASVQYFDDDDEEAINLELRARAVEQYRNFMQLGLNKGYGEPRLADPQLSFQLAHGLPNLDFLHMLLRERSEKQRLAQVIEYYESHTPRIRELERMKKVAPLNGHGRRNPVE
jgi:Lon protease-like protein